MRPKGSARELEIRREIAANMLESGKGIREVARMVKASPSTVFGWKQVLEEKGREGLKPKPPVTPKKRLGAEQKEGLKEILLKGARAAGYPTELWTLKRITEVIEKEFEYFVKEQQKQDKAAGSNILELEALALETELQLLNI